jgi:hypothetical protein
MEGFWTVQFTGVQGIGAGVATLIAGQLFGGDSGFLYTGTYQQTGSSMTARVHVKRHAAGPNVMGRSEFDLELTGTLQGNVIKVTGKIPATQLQLNGTLIKQGNLPAKAASLATGAGPM